MTKSWMTKSHRPDDTVAVSTKRLASRFYQLKMGHCLTGHYLHWRKFRRTPQCWWLIPPKVLTMTLWRCRCRDGLVMPPMVLTMTLWRCRCRDGFVMPPMVLTMSPRRCHCGDGFACDRETTHAQPSPQCQHRGDIVRTIGGVALALNICMGL